jgi:NitT/TauT family transport system ATP-binding protein
MKRLPTSIHLRNLSVAFDDETGAHLPVLDKINMDVSAGETLAVVGPSGCGKSTLLNVISGRLPPSEGKVSFGGPNSLSNFPQPGDLGVVFQDPALLPWRSVLDNIRLPLEIIGAQPNDLSVDSLIGFAGLSGFENFLPRQLSGGMRSRVGLARGLATSPSLFLMDEPFGALDELTARRLLVDLSLLLAKHHPTTLLVSHQLEQAIFLADRIIVLTMRPASIAGEVLVPFDKPRRLDIIDDYRFFECLKEVRSFLRG